MKLLYLFLLFLSCGPDYAIVVPGEQPTVYEYVEVIVTETVEIEVEVPVYIEVEVPVNEGIIWVDSFIQHMSVDGIDILWVVDRSGSMGQYNTELLSGVEAMLLALPIADWRLVMISADSSDAIVSSEFPLVPGDTAADAAAMLATLTSAPREEGFNSAYDYIMNNPYASTWMRNDAGLLIVFVSDEEEQSNIAYPAASDFISWFGSLRMGSVFMASIVNHDSSVSLCERPPSSIHVGTRFMEATNLLSGVVLDICDPDWSPGVTDATHSIDPYESLALTHKAEVDSIRVFINGALNNDWYYTGSTNTVYFTTVPTAGQLVEIGYRYIAMGDTGDSGTASP